MLDMACASNPDLPPSRKEHSRNVLICGGNGFIGRAMAKRLAQDGHRIVLGTRRPAAPDETGMDYTTDLTPEIWRSRLKHIDVVINAVGIIRERGDATFERVHHLAPIALFEAAQMENVQQVIQISALGAPSCKTAYFESKRAADAFLQTLSLRATIIRPALVYGTDGGSARFFRRLASLPVHILPAGGRQTLQPVHIDDLVELVARVVLRSDEMEGTSCIEAAGAKVVSYREMLQHYRRQMGFSKAIRIPVPAAIMRYAAALGDHIPGSLPTSDTWNMLGHGNTSDQDLAPLIGRPARGVEDFIAQQEGRALGADALGFWRAPILRGALALVWIGTSLTCIFLDSYAQNMALRARVGLHDEAAGIAFYLACLMDFLFGVLALARPATWLWLGQIGTILVYSLIIAMFLPEFLTEPFGPVLKNIPILAILVLLILEGEQS